MRSGFKIRLSIVLAFALTLWGKGLCATARDIGSDFKAFREIGDAQRYIGKGFLELASNSGHDAAIDFKEASDKDGESFGAKLGAALASQQNDGWPTELKGLAEDSVCKGTSAEPIVKLLIKCKKSELLAVLHLSMLAAMRCGDAQRKAEDGDFDGAALILGQVEELAPWYLDATRLLSSVREQAQEVAAEKELIKLAK